MAAPISSVMVLGAGDWLLPLQGQRARAVIRHTLGIHGNRILENNSIAIKMEQTGGQ